ncbi:PREDICTED: uncharacterized protein LOC109209615 [Nicotiana attenuata]|uniref:uncharacterized protein LOC109209615 n=1 Tax=Nicotiana attenuata TaxID=49451 RepID=UPI0009054EFB|nr:PREDICTED: uncharacterized protein LOC109209615 [Nicotiana attenuata]
MEMGDDKMEFITGLPHSHRKLDSIWVIVDRLTKSAHFLQVRSTYTAENYARLYIKDIVRLHGVPVSIISDHGAQFTAYFWRSFQRGLGTQVNLRWFDVGESGLHGPDLVQQAIEKVKLIRERLLIAQSRQKSYSDVRRRDLEFGANDWIFLKVSPMKGVMRFGKKGKLSPRYGLKWDTSAQLYSGQWVISIYNDSEPSSFEEAAINPVWKAAMAQEFEALHANNTWDLGPMPPGKKGNRM